MKFLCSETKTLKELGLPKNTKDTSIFLKAIDWKFESKSLPEIKYLFYCYVLSQFKTYNLRNTQDSVKIDLKKEFDTRNDLTSDFTCQGKGRLGLGCRYLKHARIGKASLKQWTLSYQERLSKLSVNYLVDSDAGLRITVENSCKVSHKNVSAVPSYLQFKVLERIWASQNYPFLFSMRFFFDGNSKDVYAKANVGSDLNWNLSSVTSDTLEDTPHIIIAGSCQVILDSMEFNNFDLESALMGAKEKMRLFWYSFMSMHKQYPFDTGSECEDDMKSVV